MRGHWGAPGMCDGQQKTALKSVRLTFQSRTDIINSMIGLERGKVILYPHNDEWNEEAGRTIKALKDILGNVATEVAHVGSTAVNTIRAKPIIDIAVAVSDFADIVRCNRELEMRGFYYRYATDDMNNILRGETDFTTKNIRQLLYACGGYYDGSNAFQTHFVHVVKAESAEWRDYIKFRDYLNSHPLVAKEYENLKIMLCQKYADHREEYTAHKHDFIQRVLDSF